MSMNVGDSSDLIHGGGGGIGVFWRSRTEFEKKLLVVIGVMILIIISLVIAVAVVGAQNSKNSNSNMLYTTTKGQIPTALVTEKPNFEEPSIDKIQSLIPGVGGTRKEPQENPLVSDHHEPIMLKTETLPTATSEITTFSHTKNLEYSVSDIIIGEKDFVAEESSPPNESIHSPVLYPTPVQ